MVQPPGIRLVTETLYSDKARGPVAKWAPNTAYAKSAPVIAPDGTMVNALAAFTSGTLYDPTKWTGNKGLMSTAGTPIGNPPLVKPAGDGRAGVWEYVHNDTTGYLYHLMMGAESGSGAWIAGIGIDGGLGNGFIFRNKAKGIGVKIEQVASISSATAYGLTVEQKSAMAPAVSMVQRNEGTANLLELFSYVTSNATVPKLQVWNAYLGNAGHVNGYNGQFAWTKEIDASGVLTVRQNNGVNPDGRKQMRHNAENGITWWGTGAGTNLWYGFRINAHASTMHMGTAASSADPDAAAYNNLISMQALGTGRLSFFGATPIVKPTAVAVTPEAIHAALVTLGLIAA